MRHPVSGIDSAGTKARIAATWAFVMSIMLAGLAASPRQRPAAAGDAKTKEPSENFEAEILAEINLARTRPLEYVKRLEEHKKRFSGNRYSVPGLGNLMSKEGTKAVDEAIEFLKKTRAVGELSFSDGLSKAAMDHVGDIGPKGMVGHDGSDGSRPADRVKRYGVWTEAVGENIAFGVKDGRHMVLQLIVDDGVPDRGHRTNMFESRFRVAGIAAGRHSTYGHMCVIDFAGGFRDKEKK